MVKQKIESIIFQNKTKDQLIEETLSSLSALLGDAFTGDDVNQLKKEFPDNAKIEDVEIKLKSVLIYIESNDFACPSIEVSIDLILEKTEYEIGTYSLVFDETCEQIDEILIIN